MANHCILDDAFIRARLAERAWSQRELADRCGFELRTLQRWLAGGRVDAVDAERVARAIESGMGAVCRELPPAYARSPLARLMPALRWLERRDAALAEPFRVLEAQWAYWASLLEFHAQPLALHVLRFPVGDDDRHTFVPLRLTFPEAGCAKVLFQAQVLPRMRFAFGEVRAEGDHARLEEYAFTRAMDGRLEGTEEERHLRVDVWVSAEVREIVLCSESRLTATRLTHAPPSNVFDRNLPELADAVCFRPAAGDLRLAGLSSWDDRLRG